VRGSLWICGQRKSVAHRPTGATTAARFTEGNQEIRLSGSEADGERGLAAIFLRFLTAIYRIERSRRYAVDPPGLRTLCAYLLLREKVIKPLLAGVVRPRGRPPKVLAPLDQHYIALREELQRTFQTIGLAA
jgi:hypothetical protein